MAGSRSVILLATASTGPVAGGDSRAGCRLFRRLVGQNSHARADILLSFSAFTIGVLFAPAIARVVRSAVLEVKTKEYVEAACAVGVPTVHILRVYVLSNIMNTVVVEAALYFGYAILVGSGLGFLGLWAQPPSPDWGLQVNDGRNFLLVAPWIAVFPALAILSLVIGINLLADGIRDLLDPK